MSKFVITVARETGSGGHNITKKLSEVLGVPYYNRDLLRKASEVSGIHEGLFGAADERIGFKEMISAAEKVYTGEVLPPDSDDYLSTRNLFSFQAKIIKELAEQESCIILGRCGNYLLQERRETENEKRQLQRQIEGIRRKREALSAEHISGGREAAEEMDEQISRLTQEVQEQSRKLKNLCLAARTISAGD